MTRARPGDMHARELISVEQPCHGVHVLFGCVGRGGVLQAGGDISGQHPSKLVDKQRLVRDFGRSETRHLESDCGMQEADSYADQVAFSSGLGPLRIVVDLEGIL